MTEPIGFLAFWPKEPHQWWARRYSHVTMFFYGGDTWVHIDIERRGVQIEVHYAHEQVQDFLSRVLHYALVVKLPQRVRSHFLEPMTCVSFIKHAFGIRSCALFPDGLLRTLRKNPDVEILNEEPEGRGIPGAEAFPPAERAGADQDDPGIGV